MRIVYCTPEISHPGGIARVTTIKANWLAEHGHNVYIVTSSQCGQPDFFELLPSVRHIDFNIGFQAGMDNSNVVKKLWYKRAKMRLYEKLLRDFLYEVKADIVVSTFCNDSDFLYKFHDGSKKILEFHFSHDGYKSVIKYGNLSFFQNMVQFFKIRKQEVIAKKYDAFVVLTNEDAASWKGYKNLHVIPNMLSFDTDEVSKLSEKHVIAIGRLDYQKKFERLLDIWKNVYNVCPGWKLNIFGCGPEKEMLEKKISDEGIKCVSINEPSLNIKEEYLNSSIFVMTSSYEGLPMTLLEAISFGLPVITYGYKCGPRDVITDGKDGYVIPEGDEQSFMSKLCFLLNNPEQLNRMGTAAKIKSENYKTDIIMNNWCDLYNTLLNK